MNTLKISDISKTYSNGTNALNGVSLTIKNGMFGLLGPNGAGKSTLMQTIASLQEPTKGEIYFNDVNIVNNPQFIREKIGYLPQEFGVYPKISAKALLSHLAVLKGITNPNERKNQVDALLQKTNLYQHRKKSVHTFSGGMRQRFGIAQALLGNPQLIIVDEPTAGLDPEERNRFLNLLSEIGEHIIVILSTHIVEDVRDLCSNMAILANGKIILHGEPRMLVNNLEEKIWDKIINKEELPLYKEKYNVISSRLISGKTQIQVFSQEYLDGFSKSIPDLESVYFQTLSNNQK